MFTMSFIGNLAADPVVRTVTISTGEQVKVANFRVAVNHGANREKLTYVECTTWRSLADTVEKYLCKGRLVAVTGTPGARHGVSQKNGQIYDNLTCTIDRNGALQFLDSNPRKEKEPAAPAAPAPDAQAEIEYDEDAPF